MPSSLYLSIAGRLHLAALAAAIEPDAWIALAAIDPGNRFSETLNELMAQPFRDARLHDLDALAKSGFTNIEVADAAE